MDELRVEIAITDSGPDCYVKTSGTWRHEVTGRFLSNVESYYMDALYLRDRELTALREKVTQLEAELLPYKMYEEGKEVCECGEWDYPENMNHYYEDATLCGKCDALSEQEKPRTCGNCKWDSDNKDDYACYIGVELSDGEDTCEKWAALSEPEEQ